MYFQIVSDSKYQDQMFVNTNIHHLGCLQQGSRVNIRFT